MKKYTSKFIALLLAVVMVVSNISTTAFAAPAEQSSKASTNEEIVLSDNTKSIIEAAKAMATVNKLYEEETEVSEEKEAVQDGIFHNHDDVTDLSEYDLTSEEMDEIVDEVLEENHMETTVDVTYDTDEDDKVTSMTVEMDSLVALAGEEAAGLTEEQQEELMAAYSQYMSYMQENADIFGVQTPYFTNKDNVCPIGSLLAIAGIPNQYLALGIDFVVQNVMSYDEVVGVVDLFHYANVFTVELKKTEIEAARDTALKAVSGAKTDVQKHLELTDWLAQNCTFDMPYIMEMEAPEVDTESAMYTDKMTIYNVMYDDIKKQVYDGYYQYLLYQEGYPEETAAQVAEMMAKSYMDDPTTDGSDNGSASAMVLASSIINLWEGNHVGALTYGTAVCLGYSNAYVYLVQSLYSNVYKNSDGTWKTYDQLNSGSNGNWSAIVDYVRITFDAEVTMYGVTQDNFQSDHYWNAVKIDGKWYYVDPCYVDVYVEVMARDRVETNGNVNHLYFLFSDQTARDLYEDYYSELDTLYQNLATETKYEDAWFAFAKSPLYKNNSTYYYLYDSTDMIELQNSNTQFSEDDIEYKIVSKSVASSNSNDASADYTTALIDFKNGQVYNPSSKKMEDNSLIKKYYDEMESYQEDYPAVEISVAYYNNKLYFNLSNCIFSYNLNSGDVQRLIEYNKVTAARDMTVAFGGMGFTASSSEGEYGITVQNPPIAGLTIRDGEMTVDIATTLGYISGKKSHTDSDDEPEDGSSYGYMFEETHYNESYMYSSYSNMGGMMGDTDNDNDEFMWSANIYETIDMSHLTSNHSNYSNVTVSATCTDGSYSEKRCSTCGLIQEASAKDTTINFNVVDAAGNDMADYTINDKLVVSSTEEDYLASMFSLEEATEIAEDALADEVKAGEIEILAVEMPETIEWNQTATANVVIKEVEKTTPITVSFVNAEGTALTDITLANVEVTATAKKFESAVKEAVASAVDTLLASDEYKDLYQLASDNAIAYSNLTWGTSGKATVTLKAVEKDTKFNVTVEFTAAEEGQDVSNESKITVDAITLTTAKLTAEELTAEAIEAAEAAVNEKISGNTDAYEMQTSTATGLSWGENAGTVTVTLKVLVKETTFNVKVEGSDVTVDPVKIKTSKSAYNAAVTEAVSDVQAAVEDELTNTDGTYTIETKATTTPAWGSTEAGTITVTVTENAKATSVVVKTNEEGVTITVADPVNSTKANLSAELTKVAEGLVGKEVEADGTVYEVKTATVAEGAKWGDTATINVTLEAVKKTTAIKVDTTGIPASLTITGLDNLSVQTANDEDAIKNAAKELVEEKLNGKIDKDAYTVEVTASDAKWGETVKVTVAATEKTVETTITVTTTPEKYGLAIPDSVTVTSTISGFDTALAEEVTDIDALDNEDYTVTVDASKATFKTGGEIKVTVTEKEAETTITVEKTVPEGCTLDIPATVKVTSTKSKFSEKLAEEVDKIDDLDNTDYTVTVDATGVTFKTGGTIIVTVVKNEVITDENTETTSVDAPTALAEGDAKATLNIKISGQNDQPSALTATGTSGQVHVFTADEIKSAVNEVLEDGNEIAITTIISDRAVAYGSSKTITVTLKSSNASHEYVEFKETYYTKSGNNWNTATCYVCINCKDAVESKPSNVISVNKNSMTKIWTWRSDFSAASVYRIPSSLSDVKLDCVWENPSIGSSRQVATSITKTMEGTCDQGVTYVYTATAGSDTDVQRDKQAAAPHQYIADEIQYVWSEDLTKCDISYKCSFCGKTGSAVCQGTDIIVDYVEPTCVVNGKTIYTASVVLEGNTYTNSQEIFNENKALGHNYEYDKKAKDEICTRCQQVKPDSKVKVSSNIKVAYTGKASAAINAVKNATTVEGSTGSTSRVYYTDKKCTKKVSTKSGASAAGKAPTKIGVYYVKVTVKADAEYKSASATCKLVIAPNQTKVSAFNVNSGIKFTWNKVKEATGYRIYRRVPGGKYEKVHSISKNTTLSWIDKKAKAGTNYEYDVRPYYKTSGGTYIYAITNADGKAAARTTLELLSGKAHIRLNWDKVSGAKSYRIYRKADGEKDYTKIATVEASETTYKDTTVKNGKNYSYYVKATGDVTTRTNKISKVFLSATSISKLTSPSKGAIKVKWDKNKKADGYRIRYSTSESFKSYKTVTVKSKNTVSKTISDLSKGKTYYVKVQSYKKVDGKTHYSYWSDAVSVKTKK